MTDVRRSSEVSTTLAAYQAQAAEYVDNAPGPTAGSGAVLDLADRFLAALGPAPRVLEIGSGPGHDALLLEASGAHVLRTDITPAFVDRLRADGHVAEVLDPLHDPLPRPEGAAAHGWDGVWADAVLLHVPRADLPTLLARLHTVTRPGAQLALTVKEGDGDGWSTHGSIEAPRHFTYWREPALGEALAAGGWSVVWSRRDPGRPGIETGWLSVLSARCAKVPGTAPVA